MRSGEPSWPLATRCLSHTFSASVRGTVSVDESFVICVFLPQKSVAANAERRDEKASELGLVAAQKKKLTCQHPLRITPRPRSHLAVRLQDDHADVVATAPLEGFVDQNVGQSAWVCFARHMSCQHLRDIPLVEFF